MANKPLPDGLIEKTKKWLKEDGVKHFRKLKNKYGEINTVWTENGIPHPVHFREGMQVRNFMRLSGLCKDWTAHELDDDWVELIEECIK